MKEIPRSLTVVLLESGSQWPRWVGGCPYRAPDAVVVAQQPDETLGSLSLRLSRRLHELRRASRRLSLAVYAVAAEHDRDRLTWRSLMARLLLRDMLLESNAALVLAAPEQTESEGRHSLLAIADTLTGGLGATGAELAVVFWSQRHPLLRQLECAGHATFTQDCAAPGGCQEQSP